MEADMSEIFEHDLLDLKESKSIIRNGGNLSAPGIHVLTNSNVK
jgi:hypothetical protein